MRRGLAGALLWFGACGGEPGASDDVGETGSTGTAVAASTGGGTTSGADDTTGGESDTTGDASESSDSSDTGEPPPIECSDEVTIAHADADNEPEGYGFTAIPPRMILADTAYGYDVRTRIGDCDTDRVEWTLLDAPPGAVLELGEDTTVQPGETFTWEDGGEAQERARLAWDLAEIDVGCYPIAIQWRAWLDCGIGDDGGWAPAVTQSFEISVRENNWVSGDLHVHTRHSERGDEAGGVRDYYERMINAQPDDLGQTFERRRFDSPRGRLHWMVFSDHTNNELEECGRHFSPWCAAGEDASVATGTDVALEHTEADPTVLLVVGSEISNQFDGHFGFVPKNPYPGHPIYAPGYEDEPTDYEVDVGYGSGVFRERWVDETATNAEELELIHEMGGLAIVNHEAAEAPWIEYDWSSLDFDGLEVWNGGNRHDRHDDDAYNGGLDVDDIVEDGLLVAEIPEDPIERSWVGMLKTGKWPVALVGGSDAHDYNEVVCSDFPCDPTNAEVASPMTTVWAPSFVWTNGEDGVVDGLAAGRVVVHDRSNFIDLRATVDEDEHMIGDTIDSYETGATIRLRAFGRVSNYIDGDNRVLLILGTNTDSADPEIDVLFNSSDTQIAPDSSFDHAVELSLSEDHFGTADAYVIWAQFVPWHNPVFLFGMGRDHAETGAIRIRR